MVISSIVALYIVKNQITEVNEDPKEMAMHPTLNGEQENIDDLSIAIIKIDIKGEVNRPGVYEVDESVRVIDVIKKAGGFTDEADESKINLAQKVTDEMVIFVPMVGDETNQDFASFNSATDSDKINVNRATLEQLTTLNGIGPKKAEAIIDYREEHGPFRQLEDMLNITGIGEKTFASFKENITIK